MPSSVTRATASRRRGGREPGPTSSTDASSADQSTLTVDRERIAQSPRTRMYDTRLTGQHRIAERVEAVALRREP